MITAGVTVLFYYLIKKFGIFTIGTNEVTLNAEGMAMLVGMLLMIYFAAQKKGTEKSNEALTKGFEANVSRIRKNWFLLAIMGGLIAAGTSLSLIAGDSASLALLVGVAVMLIEIALIDLFTKGMDRFPSVKDMGEYVRTSMNKVLEVALLAGGIVAAEKMSVAASGYAGIGALFVIGVYLLNKKSKKPIVDLAVGPVACMIFGILLNLLLVIGLIAIPSYS